MGLFRRAVSTRRTRQTKEITTATYQILETDHGKTLLLNRAAAITLTLPKDITFIGFTVKMIVRTTFSGAWEVTCQADGDLFFGGVTNTSIAAKADHFAPNSCNSFRRYLIFKRKQWHTIEIRNTVGTTTEDTIKEIEIKMFQRCLFQKANDHRT